MIRIHYLLAVVLILAAAKIVFTPPPPHTLMEPTVDAYTNAIRTVGAAQAYADMALAITPLTVGERHTHAHAFGGALYAVVGLDGISVCDARFSYGCFHEFLGHAIADKGIGIVGYLNVRCEKELLESPLSCQHGLGHGIQSYIGYEEGDLLRGLEICRSLNNNRIGGCYGGVFMEYNFRTLWGEGATTRPGDKTLALATCRELPDAFFPACIYWSPQWWLQALFAGAPTAETFSSLGALCRELSSDPAQLRDCYEGIGTVVPSSVQYDPVISAQLCDAVADTENARIFCRASAANIIAVDVSFSAAERTCADLHDGALDFCIMHAHNEANIMYRAPFNFDAL